jgi:uncharacterized paraquat-inducible protein A
MRGEFPRPGCRELYRHAERIRRSRPVHACRWCDGSGMDPWGMPGEPCMECRRPLRPWVKRALRVGWWLLVAGLVLASVCTYKGW